MVQRLARLSRQARDWFLTEIAYIAERNPAAARKIVEQMKAARRNLAQFPGLAQVGHITGTRRLVVGRSVLTIRRHRGDMHIVAIRHGRQSDALTPQEGSAVPEDEPAS